VKSLEKKIPYETYGKRKLRTIPERIVKPYKNESGYLVFELKKDTVGKKHRLHRLVAEAFLQNPENKKCVNHKDGNKENNCVENLEWVTHSENMQHAAETGLWVSWNKGKHPEGRPRSEETRKKISAALKGNTFRRGATLSEETKAKISKAKREYYRKLKESKEKAQ
jgi:hypothetical protein